MSQTTIQLERSRWLPVQVVEDGAIVGSSMERPGEVWNLTGRLVSRAWLGMKQSNEWREWDD